MEESVSQVIAEYTKDWDVSDFKSAKLLITFSAVPGAGKTTIAKRIAAYNGLARVNKDEIHDVMVKLGHAQDEELLKKVMYKLLDDLATQSKAIILDGSVDRKYAEISKWTEKQGYRMIVIQIEVEREVVEARIKHRNQAGAHEYLSQMNRWIEEHQNFIDAHVSDFVVVGNEQAMKDLELYVNSEIEVAGK